MRPVACLVGLGFLLAASCTATGVAEANDSQACFRESGDKAIAACSRVIDSSRSTRDSLVDAFTNRGQEYYVRKDYDQAISDFDVAIKLAPNSIVAYGNRANAMSATNRRDAAIADYTKAIGLDPGYTAAYTGRALEYEKKGQTSLAIADYKAALAVAQKYQDGKWGHDKARERLKALDLSQPK